MSKARQMALRAALIVVVAVTGCAEFDRRVDSGRGQYSDDAAITASVERQLARTRDRDLARVTVDTVDGTVYLRGLAANAAAKQRAAELARGVSGVRRVVDRMEVVAQRPPTGEDVRDERRIAADISARVRKSLTDDGLAGRIAVMTREGVVTLTGTVPDSNAKVRAERLSKRVAGVERVVNNLRVTTGDTSER